MKKSIILIVLVTLNFFGLKAQVAWPLNSNGTSIYYNGGNVGIGTTGPACKLHIIDASNYQTSTGLSLGSLTVANNYAGIGSNIVLFENQNAEADNQIAFFTPAQYVSGIQAQRYTYGLASSLTLNPLGGNVGIGTTTPSNKLDIRTTSDNLNIVASFSNTLNGLTALNKGTAITLGYSPSEYFTKIATVYENQNPNYLNPALAFYTMYNTYIGGTEVERMRISSNGNVGIGTTNPQYKLAVNGTIAAREVKVTAETWSDFVFHPTYKLRTLGEVEQFIKANSHLPEIPTAAEVKENGISLGEMNAKLLQKVEELTLYLIEMKKDNEDLKNRVSELEKKQL